MIIKRSDPQYIQIEEFESYELTQCIAYEMAIRSPIVKTKIETFSDYYIKNKDNILLAAYNECLDEGDQNSDLKKLFVSLIDFCEDMKIIDLFHDFEDERMGVHLQEFISILKIIHNHNNKTQPQFDNNILKEMGFTFTDKSENIKRKGYTINYSIENLSKLNTVKKENDTNETNLYSGIKKGSSTIKENFQRPKINISHLNTLDTILSLNLNRPLNELIQYITHIKKDIYENKLVKSPIELLGIDLDKSDIKISTKRLADKFFVYDYITSRLIHIKSLNKEEEDALEENIKNIKDNHYLSGKDKQIQIQELKKKHKKNVIDIKIEDILNEEDLCRIIPSGTAKRYFYEIKPYIDEEKYKELITGVIN